MDKEGYQPDIVLAGKKLKIWQLSVEKMHSTDILKK
ncbi:MAG: hypothetical protein SCARUB_00264 [Candidatus Scalindua rubra]|uniref:Uncharacterized protein n=1 Tax=Candidatus Scalindua rubra TaxID=1872076 RepID=A0A1E3XG05_9BACT|nr:MAG: hypothetical protein SCARUB_00264 [Candidatus Scalindua rubra]